MNKTKRIRIKSPPTVAPELGRVVGRVFVVVAEDPDTYERHRRDPVWIKSDTGERVRLFAHEYEGANASSDPTIAVERALDAATSARFRAAMFQRNPRLEGAHVADLLDIIDNADGALDITEPFVEAGHHGGIVVRVSKLVEGIDGRVLSDLVRLAATAVSIASGRTPTPDPAAVELVAIAAAQEVRDASA